MTQAQASLNQNNVNLQHTIIEAPIDGLVISRNVDVGQTVAASMQAPTLFVLAADLTKMQVVANLDESDVGRIRPHQNVTFRVDAYPADTFTGQVSQVRLEPKVQQNVVTYATVIDVPNDRAEAETGNDGERQHRDREERECAARAQRRAAIPADQRDLRRAWPDAARCRSTARRRGRHAARRGTGHGEQTGAACGSGRAKSRGAVDERADGRRRTRGSAVTRRTSARLAVEAGLAKAAIRTLDEARLAAAVIGVEARGGGGGGGRGGDTSGGGGNDRFAARTQGLSPEERDQMLQRMRARGIDPAAAAAVVAAPLQHGGRGGVPSTPPPPAEKQAGGATTIDALFGPLPRVESTGRAWLYLDKQLKPVRLRTGISDGQNTELIEGELEQGAEVVTNVTLTAETRPAATAFPFGQPGRGGFPGGGFQGGGGRGGGGRGR